MGHFLNIKEGVTQGYPLDTIVYSLGILSLIRELRVAQPRVTQTWYSNNAGAGGNFIFIRLHLSDLMVQGPPRGYLPESNKSILTVSPRNVPQA